MADKTFVWDGINKIVTGYGGSASDPITLENFRTDITVGAYFSQSGENNKIYTCSKNLQIGSSTENTFFRLEYSEVLKVATNYKITLFLNAMKNQYEFSDTFWSKNFGNFTPVDQSELLNINIMGIRSIYYDSSFYMDELQGVLEPVGPQPPPEPGGTIELPPGYPIDVPFEPEKLIQFKNPCEASIDPCRLPRGEGGEVISGEGVITPSNGLKPYIPYPEYPYEPFPEPVKSTMITQKSPLGDYMQKRILTSRENLRGTLKPSKPKLVILFTNEIYNLV